MKKKIFLTSIFAFLFCAGTVLAQEDPAAELNKLEATLNQYMQGLSKDVPAEQQDQLEAYRQFLLNSLHNALTPEVLQRQLEAAESMFPVSQQSPDTSSPITRTTSDQTFSLESDPISPAPKQLVTVKANFNMGNGFEFPETVKGATTNYDWYLDNVHMKSFSGVGQNSITFTSGSLGTIHNVRVRAKVSGGKVITAALLIPVVDADIIWYTDTYTPPGYRGKALANPDSPIVVAAQTFIPSNFGILNYVWTIDDDTPLNGYGINKNRVLIGLPQESHTVSVRIEDLAGNIQIEKTVTIDRTELQVLFHKIRSAKYDHESESHSGFDLAPAGRFTVIAVPYFFNVQSIDGLRFKWTFDGGHLPEAVKDPDVFTLNIGQSRVTAGTRYEKTLQLSIENKNPKRNEAAVFTIPVSIH